MAMTANDGRGFTNEELDEFLMSGRIFAKIATTMEDGWPVISPVWYEWDGESFLIGLAQQITWMTLTYGPQGYYPMIIT